jgi:hypothetical protein
MRKFNLAFASTVSLAALAAGGALDVPEGHTLSVLVLSGKVEINGQEIVSEAQTAILSQAGGGITIVAKGDAKLLVLSGAPIDEPVVAHGPFVMRCAETDVRFRV